MIIKTYTLPSGAVVRVHDDFIAPRGSEEERRAIARQNAVARAILEKRAAAANLSETGIGAQREAIPWND